MTSYVSSDVGVGGGGLGNQLFKLAAILDYGNKYNKIPVICNLKKDYYNEAMILLNKFFTEFTKNKLNTVSKEELNSLHFTRFTQENSRIYQEVPYIEGNVYIGGYLESYKYIGDDARNIMNDLIYSNIHYVNIAKSLFNIVKEHFNDYDEDNYICIHIRRGDKAQYNTHLNYDYMKRAYEKIKEIKGKNMNVIVFSDDTNWCYDNINFLPNTYYLDNISNMYIELILMSMINSGILNRFMYGGSPHRSTFSWWGAFLGNKNKTIIIPDKIGKDVEDYYLPEWILVE